jgi:hypothetical protein
MIVDDPDNSVERFTYSKREWSDIKTVVRDVLNRDADQLVLESARMDGTKYDETLRAMIEGTASVHLARDRVMRSLPTQMAFRKQVTVLREDAQRLRDGIDRLHPFRATHNGYSPDKDMEFASEVFFPKLLRNLDGIIDALGPPRKKTGSAASKNMGRDLFWSEVILVWCKIGGEEAGVADSADFLIAVSLPVFNAMPHDTRDEVPKRQSVIQWLRRRSPQG